MFDDWEWNDTTISLTMLIGAVVGVICYFAYSWIAGGDKEPQYKRKSDAIEFKTPVEKEVYVTRKKELDIADPYGKDELMSLLIKRALKTLEIVLEIENKLKKLESLVRRQRITMAEFEDKLKVQIVIKEEIEDIKKEANIITPGWGELIITQAFQFNAKIAMALEQNISMRELEEQLERQRNTSNVNKVQNDNSDDDDDAEDVVIDNSKNKNVSAEQKAEATTSPTNKSSPDKKEKKVREPRVVKPVTIDNDN